MTMKNIKIRLRIALFALSTFSFGQLLSENLSDLVFNTSYSDLASIRVEHYVERHPARIFSGDFFEAPAESTFHQADMQLESWMLSPFENSYSEEELVVEPWMTRPFISDESYAEPLEEEIEVEEWMTRPFAADERI
jgi:hypothetical protein